MKKMLFISALSFVLFLSCEKENPKNPPTTQLSKKEILVSKSWEVDELLHNVSCENSHYMRGGENTTGITYDVLRFTFNANGTGTHINQDGTAYTTTWQFLTNDDRNLRISLNGGSTFDWNLVEITDSTVHGTVSFITEGSNILESFRLVPIQ
jgi:hypothetical protein